MSERNLIEELKELAALHDSGALTEDEYAAAKAKILNPEQNYETLIPEVVDVEVDPKYTKYYSEESFWDKILSTIKKAGVEIIYKALQLYYATRNPACPLSVKTAIWGALGYFIFPFDLIPDFIPGIGYTDDLAAIAAAIAMAHAYIDDSVIEKAKYKMKELFGEDILKEIEK